MHCYRKAGEQPNPKSIPKHPIEVHVLAGTSMRGTAKIHIFEGLKDAKFYTEILQLCLVPVTEKQFSR